MHIELLDFVIKEKISLRITGLEEFLPQFEQTSIPLGSGIHPLG
tara:strand:- start:39664 stop:39795 length:132 start_codon:yes stop_codon:yes gene_type:complete